MRVVQCISLLVAKKYKELHVLFLEILNLLGEIEQRIKQSSISVRKKIRSNNVGPLNEYIVN